MSLDILRRVDYASGPEGIVNAELVNIMAFNIANAVDYEGFDDIGEELQLRTVFEHLINFNHFTVGGTANDVEITNLAAVSTYVDGMYIKFTAKHTNTGSMTLKVNSGNALAMKMMGGDEVPAGFIRAGEDVIAIFNGTDFTVLSISDRKIIGNLNNQVEILPTGVQWIKSGAGKYNAIVSDDGSDMSIGYKGDEDEAFTKLLSFQSDGEVLLHKAGTTGASLINKFQLDGSISAIYDTMNTYQGILYPEVYDGPSLISATDVNSFVAAANSLNYKRLEYDVTIELAEGTYALNNDGGYGVKFTHINDNGDTNQKFNRLTIKAADNAEVIIEGTCRDCGDGLNEDTVFGISASNNIAIKDIKFSNATRWLMNIIMSTDIRMSNISTVEDDNWCNTWLYISGHSTVYMSHCTIHNAYQGIQGMRSTITYDHISFTADDEDHGEPAIGMAASFWGCDLIDYGYGFMNMNNYEVGISVSKCTGTIHVAFDSVVDRPLKITDSSIKSVQVNGGSCNNTAVEIQNSTIDILNVADIDNSVYAVYIKDSEIGSGYISDLYRNLYPVYIENSLLKNFQDITVAGDTEDDRGIRAINSTIHVDDIIANNVKWGCQFERCELFINGDITLTGRDDTRGDDDSFGIILNKSSLIRYLGITNINIDKFHYGVRCYNNALFNNSNLTINDVSVGLYAIYSSKIYANYATIQNCSSVAVYASDLSICKINYSDITMVNDEGVIFKAERKASIDGWDATINNPNTDMLIYSSKGAYIDMHGNADDYTLNIEPNTVTIDGTIRIS